MASPDSLNKPCISEDFTQHNWYWILQPIGQLFIFCCNFEFSRSLFLLLFFSYTQVFSRKRPKETFYTATPSSTLLIKILNMEREIPLKPLLQLHILLLPWPPYLQTLSQILFNCSILRLLMFKSNLNYLKLHEGLASDLIMFKYSYHPIRKWFHNSIKTAIGFVRSNLFYRTYCLLQIISLAFKYLHFLLMFLTLRDGAEVNWTDLLLSFILKYDGSLFYV